MSHPEDKLRYCSAIAATVACVLLPTAASANGAMSLALATFSWWPWFGYVIVTILYEALAMGRLLRVPTGLAIKLSVKANFITAVLGGYVSGIVCAFLGFYGGQYNPNPFGRTLFLFTLFGIGSAILESVVWSAWNIAPGTANLFGLNAVASKKTALHCMAVHLVGVPIGMAILLIPSHPYPGLSGQVYTSRVHYFEERQVRKALREYIGEHQVFPPVHSYGELISFLSERSTDFPHDPDLWAAAYVPDYERFDTTEMQRRRIEWNTSLAGTKIPEIISERVWLVRSEYYGNYEGLVLDPEGLRFTYDRKQLGYKASPDTVH